MPLKIHTNQLKIASFYGNARKIFFNRIPCILDKVLGKGDFFSSAVHNLNLTGKIGFEESLNLNL